MRGARVKALRRSVIYGDTGLTYPRAYSRDRTGQVTLDWNCTRLKLKHAKRAWNAKGSR